MRIIRMYHNRGIAASEDYTSGETQLIIEYAKVAFKSAWDAAEAMTSNGDTRGMIILQYMYFYIHVTSISLKNTVSKRHYNRLTEQLVDACGLATASVFCKGEPEAHLNRIRDQFEHQAAVAESDYGRFERLLANADEDATETLVWQFGCVIAMALGKDDDSAIIAATAKTVTELLSRLDPDGFAKKLARTG